MTMAVANTPPSAQVDARDAALHSRTSTAGQPSAAHHSDRSTLVPPVASQRGRGPLLRRACVGIKTRPKKYA